MFLKIQRNSSIFPEFILKFELGKKKNLYLRLISCHLFQTQVNGSNAKNITENLVMETADNTELDSYDVFLATSTLVHIVEYTSSLDQVSLADTSKTPLKKV